MRRGRSARVSDPSDERPGSQPYLPPPPESRDDAPRSVHFPRMDPPPASLEAMVRNGPRSASRAGGRSWVWVLALVAGVALTAYFLGLHR